MRQCMDSDNLHRRLKKIIGQVQAIDRMIDEMPLLESDWIDDKRKREETYRSILEEGDGYDMLVMGRSEGEGCYCFVNGILKQQVQKISDHYKYVITDNEAGMEHISRKLTKHVDTLILVSDCAKRSIQAVARIRDLAKEMNLSVGKIGLIVNKAPNGELSNGVKEEIEKYGLDLFGVVPSDELIYEYDSEGIPLVKLPADSKSRVALEKIIETLDLP